MRIFVKVSLCKALVSKDSEYIIRGKWECACPQTVT